MEYWSYGLFEFVLPYSITQTLQRDDIYQG